MEANPTVRCSPAADDIEQIAGIVAHMLQTLAQDNKARRHSHLRNKEGVR